MFFCQISPGRFVSFSQQNFYVSLSSQFVPLLRCRFTVLHSTFIQYRKFLQVFVNFLDIIFLKIITFVYLQWSSSHEERTKIIREGLLNPSVDILEAMTETEAMHTGKTLIHFQISTPSLCNQNHPSSAHSHSNVTIIFISPFF